MTPAARAQAAIEILDAVIVAAREGGAAADTLVQRYFSSRRYAGSKDRRAVRELVFEVIRAIGEPPANGRAALIGYARAGAPELLATFGEGGHGPAALIEGEAGAALSAAPEWLRPALARRFGGDIDAQVAALLTRAPLDLRVNRLKATREQVLAELPDLTPTPFAADGLRAPAGLQVEGLAAWAEGRIEVQDEGSQLAALAVGALPGETVVDLCAGAGGKTLALAAAMADQGRIIAADIDRGRLQAMPPRLARAGVTIAEPRLLDPRREAEALADLAGRVDRVLIDAPCSGTGTWRRNPEARWRLTPERLARLTAEQDRLLDLATTLLRPGGTLTYVVCSLLPDEGEERIAALLARQSGLIPQSFCNPVGAAAVTSLVLTPGSEGCDGFFIAQGLRSC
ncbi:RNA methyltransferase [alpha proteobacterium AAP81b]|nr:RNA methyltransferase [alpha proteobacterium AAP81b]